MKPNLLIDVLFLAAFASQSCGDHETENHWAGNSEWREIEIPEFREMKHIGDTKVYRLRKNHEFVFVLSVGRYLDRDHPRTAYIGHVDADDTVTLTNLKKITERNTNDLLFPDLYVLDMADPHVHVPDYDSDHLWVSWTCGLDTHVCAIRSEDGGKSFNDDTFSIVRATGLLGSTHEPSMTCNRKFDCLLTWGEKLSKTKFDMYTRRFTPNGWCPASEKQRIGSGLGLPLEMSAAVGNNGYLLSAVDPGLLGFDKAELASADLRYTNNECYAETDHMTVIDSDFAIGASAADGFHYSGGAGNTAPRCSVPSLPTWQIYSCGCGLSAIRRNESGQVDSASALGDPDPRISVMAGNVDFDGERFFVFYHKFCGVGHPEHANTYSICYRSTVDAESTDWSEESCPVENLPGLTARGSEFGNMIQPVGSAWKGNISLIFQKDCNVDACSLALKRLERDSY